MRSLFWPFLMSCEGLTIFLVKLSTERGRWERRIKSAADCSLWHQKLEAVAVSFDVGVQDLEIVRV